jgi:hypothetical protein
MTSFDSVMDIAKRPPVVFVAGQGSWSLTARAADISIHSRARR